MVKPTHTIVTFAVHSHGCKWLKSGVTPGGGGKTPTASAMSVFYLKEQSSRRRNRSLSWKSIIFLRANPHANECWAVFLYMLIPIEIKL